MREIENLLKNPKNELLKDFQIISIEDYFMGRLDFHNHPEIAQNAQLLLNKIDLLFKDCPFYITLSSGYRSPEINAQFGGSKQSTHMTGQGIDIKDPTGIIKKYVLNNWSKVLELGLFMEDPKHTKTWCHLQTRPTKNNPFTP